MKEGVLLLSENFEDYTQPIILFAILLILGLCVLYYSGNNFVELISAIDINDIDFD